MEHTIRKFAPYKSKNNGKIVSKQLPNNFEERRNSTKKASHPPPLPQTLLHPTLPACDSEYNGSQGGGNLEH